MDDLEARLRCLELAATLARAQGKSDAPSVVEIQTALYSHLTSDSPSVKPPSSGAPKRKGTTP